MTTTSPYIPEKIKIIEKPNDTLFTTKLELTLAVEAAGRVVLTNSANNETYAEYCDANVPFSAKLNLIQGRNEINIVFEGYKELAHKTLSFVCRPDFDIVVDAAFSGTDGEICNGFPTYSTINAALASLDSDNSIYGVIFVKNGRYEERVTVTAPYVSILGEDAEKTYIVNSRAKCDGTATGMWDRNVMYIDTAAECFSLENMKIENTFDYTNEKDNQADALCCVADNAFFSNVKLVSFQDTLMVDSREKAEDEVNTLPTHQLFTNCYITGNIDFIYGSGSAVFENCDIVGRYTPHKADGCFTAARTCPTTPYGLVFRDCRFYAEPQVEAGSYRLARPWGADASTVFIDCYMSDVVRTEAYDNMSGHSFADARFFESGCYGEGAAAHESRRQLTGNERKALLETIVLS